MVKITLEPAKNGLIKRTFDDNHGGSKEQWTSTDVYEESEIDKLSYVMKFFFDLCEDLGVNVGSKFDSEVITIKKEWGSHYEPTDEILDKKIKELEAQLQLLKECRKS
jgi:hypothetical protein